MWHLSRHPYAAAFGRVLAHTFARTVTPLFIAPAKVIVLDLDNTLWGGVIGEDGLGGIALGDSGPGSAFVELQHALLALRSHGVLLCVASKNNEADAFEVFDKHPAMVIKREHLAAWRINWQPKSQSLAELAKELSVGIDSLVFLDDSPTECAEVRAMQPQVTVVQLPPDAADYVATLRAIPVLDRVLITAEDRARAEAISRRARAHRGARSGHARPGAARRVSRVARARDPRARATPRGRRAGRAADAEDQPVQRHHHPAHRAGDRGAARRRSRARVRARCRRSVRRLRLGRRRDPRGAGSPPRSSSSTRS